MTDIEQRRHRLLTYLRDLPPKARQHLDELKARGARDRERPDFVWYFLLTSFSTMGSSRGFDGLMSDPENFAALSYETIRALSPTERRSVIEQRLRKAKIRMPAKKAGWLAENFNRIEGMGGLSRATAIAHEQPNREAKIAFLKQFKGIADKYARNIWMDVYHPDFHDAVAIDQRIKNVSAALGIAPKSYAEHERFYQDLAAEAGLQAWELDRVLYANPKDVLQVIHADSQDRLA